ncbi:CRISPR-associated protein Cas4 [Marinitoga piezophila KA3]|uniref:CRISPR-associated exonuclease Cas4 n=1 Tax=Marinitoga piezophila (strain DSM 14283 / JCM 11233 / KA3) TaxID=443254 RepID=H2J401_MARPK|nr:CRISPR-associated protein Cas4 [Marinitoga piezophila]AEX84729.1 CRISPR-associated protein Cas4 [Marinitoga piezophila KA3]
MKNKIKIYGSLIQSYFICKRQTWLLAHQLIGEQDNMFIEIGRFIAEKSYQNTKKEIKIDGGIIDFIKKENGKTIVAEVKKSSKNIKSAEYQLLFYLKKLKGKIDIQYAEIRIPVEKKIIKIELTEEKEKELEKIEEEIITIINKELPPMPEKIKYCKTCSYQNFCWG